MTDARVLAREDLGIGAAAIAAAGPAVALHVREPGAGGRSIEAMVRRFLALAGPPEAAILVNGHPEIAAATGAQGVQLGCGGLSPADARRVMPRGWIGCSVHSEAEAEAAAAAGADFLVAGSIFETGSHPGRAPVGTGLLRRCAALGLPVIAVGGITVDRVEQVRESGAWGVACISALWDSPDPAGAALAMLAAWRSGT